MCFVALLCTAEVGTAYCFGIRVSFILAKGKQKVTIYTAGEILHEEIVRIF